MDTRRLEALQALLAQNADNILARYGLAIEYVKTGDPERGVAEFRDLIGRNPDYAAAYFHAGQALENLGRIEEARSIYEEGIAVTVRTGDAHTGAELQAALDMLPT
jgi:tetratricopeptide (TPR) repeat protein